MTDNTMSESAEYKAGQDEGGVGVKSKWKTRITLTEGQLEHLFITMDSICAAGSENVDDAEVTLLLAHAMHRRGLTCPSTKAWRHQGLARYGGKS